MKKVVKKSGINYLENFLCQLQPIHYVTDISALFERVIDYVGLQQFMLA